MMREPLLKDVLTYALGGSAPERFLECLIRRRALWDEVFRHKLDDFAYELWPERAVWELHVDEEGRLEERRLPMLE